MFRVFHRPLCSSEYLSQIIDLFGYVLVVVTSCCVAIIDLFCHIVGYVFDSCGIYEARGENLRCMLPRGFSDAAIRLPDLCSLRCLPDDSEMPARCRLNSSPSTTPPPWFLFHCPPFQDQSSLSSHQQFLGHRFSLHSVSSVIHRPCVSVYDSSLMVPTQWHVL